MDEGYPPVAEIAEEMLGSFVAVGEV